MNSSTLDGNILPPTQQYKMSNDKDKPFPKEQGCKLDVDVLKSLGCTRKCMEEKDALFLNQLLI